MVMAQLPGAIGVSESFQEDLQVFSIKLFCMHCEPRLINVAEISWNLQNLIQT